MALQVTLTTKLLLALSLLNNEMWFVKEVPLIANSTFLKKCLLDFQSVCICCYTSLLLTNACRMC